MAATIQGIFNRFSELANSKPKKEAREEKKEQLKPATMNEEEYYNVFSISVNGDHAPALDLVVDNPQIRELRLIDSAGVDTKIKTVTLHDKIFNLQFFFFSKQEQFKFLRSKFKPDAIIIVYDATSIVSFNKALMSLEKTANSNSSVCTLLVGNDHNLNNNDVNKVVKTDTGKELAKRFKIYFIETSAENHSMLEQDLRRLTELIESTKIYKTGDAQMEG